MARLTDPPTRVGVPSREKSPDMDLLDQTFDWRALLGVGFDILRDRLRVAL